MKKLTRFDIIELLLYSENHRRLIIPNLIKHCENYDPDNIWWKQILSNFRKSPLVYCHIYYNFQQKTTHGMLDGIIYLTTVKTVAFETEIFYAELGTFELIFKENIDKFISASISNRGNGWMNFHHSISTALRNIEGFEFVNSFSRKTKAFQ